MDETTIDLKEIIKILKKRKATIIKVFLSLVILAAAVSFIIPSTYEAESNLRVKQPKGLADSLLNELPMDVGPNSQKQLMATYAEILKSRTVIQEVIDKTQSEKEDIPTCEDMLKTIDVKPVKDTEILNIKVRAKSPEEAKYVANTLVDIFNARLTVLARTEKKTVREFIGQRMQESKKELEQAEDVLTKYKSQQKIVAPDDETRIMVEKLTAIKKMAAENDVALATARAKLGSAQQELADEKPGFVAESPLIQQYKSKLAEEEVNLVALSAKYNEKHPEIMAAKASIEDTRIKLNTEIGRVLSAEASSMNPIHQGLLQARIMSEADAAAGVAQKQEINRIIAEGEQEINKLPTKEQGLARVMRDAALAQEIYVMLAKRHEEARIAEVMESTDVTIIDEAVAPDKPVSPKKLLNIVIAAILGLFVGTSLVFFQEYYNKTVQTAEDVRHYLDLPVLGTIPDFDSNAQSTNKERLWKRIAQLVTNKAKRGREL